MNDSKEILTLLSIPSEDVSHVTVISDSNDISFIEIDLKDKRTACPFCFSSNVVIKDYYPVQIKNSIVRNKKLYVKINVRRFRCKNCNKTFKQKFSFYEDNHILSKATVNNVQKMLTEPLSMEYIAKELDISKQTVINILEKMPDPSRLKLPRVMCVDEFHFSNANTKAGKYPFVISTPFSTEIIDIVESRHQEYLAEYFSDIEENERNNVRYYVTDMNESYRSIHKRFFKNSVHIVDHFHIIKLFTEAVQMIRKRIMNENKNEENEKEYRYLKSNWKLFLKNRYDLRDKKITNKRTGVTYYVTDEIDLTLKKYPDLHEIYWNKEEFCDKMLKLHEREEVENYMNFFIKKYSDSSVPEIRKIGSTFSKWKEEITNAYAKNDIGLVITNAIAESNNNFIQTLINISYGYTNFHHLRKRILFMSSNRKTRKCLIKKDD